MVSVGISQENNKKMGKGNSKVSLSYVGFDKTSRYLEGHARDIGGVFN